MKKFSLLRMRGLFFKIGLMVLVLLIISIGPITVVSIRQQTKTIKEDLIEKNKTISTHLASSAKNAFWSLNWHFVERQMKEATNAEDIIFLAIIKPNGETYISAGDKDYGDNLLRAIGPFHETQMMEDVSYAKTGEETKGIITPIRIGNNQWYLIMGLSLQQIENARQEILKTNIGYGSIIFFLGMVLSFFFSRGIYQRINHLMSGIEEIAKGNLDYKIGEMGSDELGMLAVSFDRMSENLKETTTSRDLLVKEMAERKRAEKAFQAQQAQLTSLFNYSGEAIVMLDIENKIIDMNPAFEKIFGYSIEEACGKSIEDLICPERFYHTEAKEFYNQSLQDVRSAEVKRRRKDGKEISVCASAGPIKVAGTLVGRFAVFDDITERKEAEKALQESEAQKTAILDGSIDRIRLVDKDLRIIWANKTTTRDINMTSEDLIGHTCFESLAGRNTPCPGCPALKARISGKIEHALVYQSHSKATVGESYWEDYAVPIKNESGEVVNIIEITRNVTDHKRIETEMIEAKNFLQNILNSSIDGITTTDFKGKIIYTSPRTKDILGYKQEEIIGNQAYTLYGNGIEDAKIIMKKLSAKGEINDHEMKLIRKDKTLIDINLSASLLRNEAGEIVGTLGIYRDITEKNKLEAQLAQAQRIEALGTLAGGIAHNFNNLLMGIQGNVSLMLLEIDREYPNYERLKAIEQSIQSGSRLTRQLLGYAREGRYEIKPISLNRLVKETSEAFSLTKKEIRIHQDLAQDLYEIKADQGQIEQVLLNLYVNATDAMPRGGDLFLKTLNVTDQDIKKKPFRPKPGNYAALTVRDTGTGINKKTMKRIFEPFFTTKGFAKGTGLGLASAYGIIKAHGGYIDANSIDGNGTIFSIYLPASEKKTEKPMKSKAPITRGKETILLVDDEEAVLDVSAHMLTKVGYTVFEAKGGREAVEIYKENKDKINMVILDIIMPEMSGSETYDRMKEINPDIKVLLSSGYNIEGQASEILDKGCAGFIHKPFNMQELSQGIRKILGEEKPS
jgi:two-component system, cell cycle sensor histidine kinase and response regulator CckA